MYNFFELVTEIKQCTSSKNDVGLYGACPRRISCRAISVYYP